MPSICRGLFVLLAVASAGPAGAEDAPRDCTAAAQTYMEINASSGVYTEQAVAVAPLTIKVPTGVDPRLEAECLKVEGRDAGSKMTAEFERAETCRQTARQVRITGAHADEPAQIGGKFDSATYEACLRGDIEVDVLDTD